MTDKEFLDIQQEKEYQNKLVAALLAMREYENVQKTLSKPRPKTASSFKV